MANSGSTRGQSIAQGLGWFSIGLGLAQLLAPRRVARLVGLNEDDDRNIALMRAIGVRELTTGIGIFSQRNQSTWLWARTAGDVMDLALISMAMRDGRSDNRRLGGAAVAVLGAAVIDAMAARQRSNPEVTALPEDTHDEWADYQEDGVRHVRKAITINRPPEEVSRLLDDVDRRPAFSKRTREVELCVTPGPRGDDTEIHVDVAYEPRFGRIGAKVSKLAHKDPASEILEDLRRLKQIAEVGEIVHSDASIHRGPHPAQPDPEANVS